jgi:predicted NBD/HSP70 family sugar kinase
MYTLHSLYSGDVDLSDPSLTDELQSVACIEVGGSSVQTVIFGPGGSYEMLPGAQRPVGHALAIAVPGLIADGWVVEASNLGWRDVDPVEALGLDGPVDAVLNDAEAAALGEAWLRGGEGLKRLVYLGIGTGIGGAVVEHGKVVAENLFGHTSGFGGATCQCGRKGCLETVAAGWSLPDPIDPSALARSASSIADAVRRNPLAAEGPLVVVGGGIARRYPQIVDLIAEQLPDLRVEPTRAPVDAKSAAPWGLLYMVSDPEASFDGHAGHDGRPMSPANEVV